MIEDPLALNIFIDMMFATIFGGGGIIAFRVYSGPAKGPMIRGQRNRLSPRENAVINVAIAQVMMLFGVESLAQAVLGFVTDYLNLSFANIITQILWSITILLSPVVPIIFIIQTIVIFMRQRRNPSYHLAPTMEPPLHREDASSGR